MKTHTFILLILLQENTYNIEIIAQDHNEKGTMIMLIKSNKSLPSTFTNTVLQPRFFIMSVAFVELTIPDYLFSFLLTFFLSSSHFYSSYHCYCIFLFAA